MRTRTPIGNAESSNVASPAPSTDLKRRRFLFSLSAGGVGAAAASVAALPGSAAADDGAAPDKVDSGYRETQHIRDYYRTTRI